MRLFLKIAHWTIGLSLTGILVFACKKDGNTDAGTRKLLGKWVDIEHRSDTLYFFKDSRGLMMFDNSMAYRSHPNVSGITDYYISKVRLADGGIYVTPLALSSTQESTILYAFSWLLEGKQFEIVSASFRAYLSCSNCMLQFEKVN